jgi:hypothetical protein
VTKETVMFLLLALSKRKIEKSGKMRFRIAERKRRERRTSRR